MIGNLNGDFRGSLETAVAYRITEMNPLISVEAAHVRVCDFAKYGMNSPYHKVVLEAIVDLYGAVIATAIPFARSILQTIIQETERQNARGRAGEVSRNGDPG